ncbi:MAG: Mn2+/Fe2+ NRAMP family transporter [Verrucomicrobiales bacterium]|jgi:Mn2+/Fe2+ NRAMP family transporter
MATDDSQDNSLAEEKALLVSVEGKGPVTKARTYMRLCGPGWLQSAITLGGGSLVGALGLGLVGGTNFMWVQPIAMILGVIMLSAIAYVTLSTGERPFKAINEHISPVLGWGWLIATMLANMIWCLPQFNLAFGAVTANLAPGMSTGLGSKIIISGVVLSIATLVIWSYGTGSNGVKLFENILKGLVGLVVLSFIGVVVALTFAKGSPLDWSQVFSGFIPDVTALFRPAPAFQVAIDQLSAADATTWTEKITSTQRNTIITAVGTAVGINMTFLLPYSMLKRRWGREHRGLAIFDLSTGLVIPFVIATGCLVIAAATQFHNNPANYKVAQSASLTAELKAAATSDEAFKASLKTPTVVAQLKADYEALPQEKKAIATLEMMTAKRSQLELASSLEPFTGKFVSQYLFGFGVLAMAISTIVILMLINGFAFCEALGVAHSGTNHRIGCLIAGIVGFFGPIIWASHGPWLAIPTSVAGYSMLPIAAFAFLLLLNSKSLLGDDKPKGGSLIRWNILMGTSTAVAALGSCWASYGKIGWWGPGLIVAFAVATALTWRGGGRNKSSDPSGNC